MGAARRLAAFIASTAFIGYAPLAPGTAGALAAAAVYWWLVPGGWWPAAVGVATTAAGVWAAGEAERAWGGKDPRRICWDEFASLFVAVAFLPKTWVYLAAAFLALRFYAVVKPFPAGRAQRLPGGWGIMADDVVAGVYANVTVQLMRIISRGLGWWPELFR